MRVGTTGGERAVVWAIAIGLTVALVLQWTIERFAFGDLTVVFGLAALGLIAATGYGYAHGGVVGSVLLAVAPLFGGVGVVSFAGVVAPVSWVALPADSGLVWELAIALVVGLVIGTVGWGLGRGAGRVGPAGRRESTPGSADR